MDPSRALLAIEELEKWRERKRRLAERLRQVRTRKQFLLRDLEIVRKRIADLSASVVAARGSRVTPVEIPSTLVGVLR